MSRLPVYEHVVQYYETDRMQVVHHSNYIRWFEEARVYIFEQIGLSYKAMEDTGIVSPVVSVEAEFKSMTGFYDTVIIEVRFTKYTGVRLNIEYTVKDKETGTVRCTGRSSHCFIDPDSKVISIKKSYPEYDTILSSYLEE
ncbi:MAG: acyl-CoA thioesterase [Clostridiales bacterium]|nr:acyl-CoA thioesterase [Clostridiales bacterium]